MIVLQILLQIWQSIPIRVGLSIVFWKISAQVFLGKALSDFFFLGGGGCKKCWVRQRELESLARFPL